VRLLRADVRGGGRRRRPGPGRVSRIREPFLLHLRAWVQPARDADRRASAGGVPRAPPAERAPEPPERGTRPRLRGGGAGASDRSGGADDERADQRRDSGQGRERHEEARLLRTGSFGQRRRVPPLARLPSQELGASAVCRWAFPGGCVAARAASLPGAPVLDEPGRAPRSGPRPSFVGAAVCSSHSARLRSGRFGQRSSDSMTSRRWVAAKSAGTSGGRRTRDSRGLAGRAVTVGVGDAMNSPCGVEDRSALGVQASTGVSPGSVGGGASSAAR